MLMYATCCLRVAVFMYGFHAYIIHVCECVFIHVTCLSVLYMYACSCKNCNSACIFPFSRLFVKRAPPVMDECGLLVVCKIRD